MKSITEELLKLVSDWKGGFTGAFQHPGGRRLRRRQSTEHIKIEPKQDLPRPGYPHSARNKRGERVPSPPASPTATWTTGVQRLLRGRLGRRDPSWPGAASTRKTASPPGTTASTGFSWRRGAAGEVHRKARGHRQGRGHPLHRPGDGVPLAGRRRAGDGHLPNRRGGPAPPARQRPPWGRRPSWSSGSGCSPRGSSRPTRTLRW